MHLFYTPDISDNSYTLSESESKHCIKVLRLKIDDLIFLIDGKGGFYTAKITNDHQKNCMVEVVEKKENFEARNHYLHIAIAPTKNNDRFEWFLEKATELGIDEITPIICERSERKVIKTDRLSKVIISAVKQSIKAFVPRLNEAVKLEDFLRDQQAKNKYIAHCEESEKIHINSIKDPIKETIILIGPEGDFSKEEIEKAVNLGYKEISLGKSRLRTETAGVAACHIVNLLNEE